MALQGIPESSDMNIARFRIERGATVVGRDGQLGTVEQIVVDRESGELRALIVRSRERATEFEMDASHVERSTGEHVYVNIGQGDIAARPDLARPYDASQYMPVQQGETTAVSDASRIARATEHPVVTEVEDNAAELVAPETHTTPTPANGTAPMSATDTAITSGEAITGTAGVMSAMSASNMPPTDEVVTVRPVTMDAQPTTEDVTALNTTPVVDETEQGAEQITASEEITDEDEAPTVPRVPLAAPETRDPERPMPHLEPSATPSTTGPLVNDRPSSSGMGDASTVPTASPASQDTEALSADTLAQETARQLAEEPMPLGEPESLPPLRTDTPTRPLSQQEPASAGNATMTMDAPATSAAQTPGATSASSGRTVTGNGPSPLWVALHLPTRYYYVAGGLLGGIILGLILRSRNSAE